MTPRINRYRIPLCVLCLLTSDVSSQEDDPPLDPAVELARAVDLPTPKARRSAARKLAKRDVSLDEWLGSMRSFGAFEPPRHGLTRHEPDLQVLKKREPTEIFVYVPPTCDRANPAPLLMMMHGTGGSGRGLHYMWQKTADELSMIVACPSEAGANEGYAFSERERAATLAALRWVRRHHNVDENRITISGISRGGHIAWDMALRYPGRFAAIAPMIGGPRINIAKGQNNIRLIENIAGLPIRDLQGLRDDPGLIFNLRMAFAKLKQLGAADARFITFEHLGHSFEFETVEWTPFLKAAVRDPIPRKIIHRCTRKHEASSHWVEIQKMGRNVAYEFRPKVKASIWNGLDKEGKLRFLQDEADKRTARLEIERTGPTTYRAKGKGVSSFRLLLARGMFAEGSPVRVAFRGRSRKLRVRPDKKVLLEHFVEHFDRNFLPLAQVIVK